MMYDGPILDNHFHMNPQGLHVEAAKIFQKVGGTHLVLVHCPDFSQPPTTRKGHVDAYQKTIEMAESTRKLGLGVKVILGPHPAAFAHQFETLGEDAETNYWNSIDAALDFVQEQKAHGIGEVGRPHWPVSEDIWNRSNALLLETMKLAKKEDIPLQLHVEGDSNQTYAELAKMADKAGLDRSKLVRHYAPSNIADSHTCGLTPSVLAGKGSVDEILSTLQENKSGFFLETDYMDDPRRPGAVLGPKTVPKRTRQLIEKGLDSEILWHTHSTLPKKIYGDF